MLELCSLLPSLVTSLLLSDGENSPVAKERELGGEERKGGWRGQQLWKNYLNLRTVLLREEREVWGEETK